MQLKTVVKTLIFQNFTLKNTKFLRLSVPVAFVVSNVSLLLLLEMPKVKRKNPFNKEPAKKKKKIEIVTLSDTEDSKNPIETEDVVIIADDLNEGEHSVINLTEDTPTDKFSFHIDRTPDFIPINNTDKKIRPRRRKKTTQECSFAETPVIKLKHSNLLNTKKNLNQPHEQLRPVIIDGSNVAFR